MGVTTLPVHYIPASLYDENDVVDGVQQDDREYEFIPLSMASPTFGSSSKYAASAAGVISGGSSTSSSSGCGMTPPEDAEVPATRADDPRTRRSSGCCLDENSMFASCGGPHEIPMLRTNGEHDDTGIDFSGGIGGV